MKFIMGGKRPEIERKISMRHTLVKLTGLLLVLVLALAGCNLIEIDPMMQLDEDFAKLEKDYSTVVVNYDGGTITKGEVMGPFNSAYSYNAQYFSMYGMSIDAGTTESLKQQVLEEAVENVAVTKQFEARGLSISDEKQAEIDAAVDENYKAAYDSFYDSAEGKTDEVRARQTEYNLYLTGYSRDAFYNSQMARARFEAVQEAVRGEIAELNDEELQAYYDGKVAEQEEEFTSTPGSFESHMSSDAEVVVWMPEGYRTVKHILIKPDEEKLTAVTTARSALTTAENTLEGFESELEALNDDDAPEAEAEGDAAAEASEAPARTAEEIQADIDLARIDVDNAKADVDAAEADCLASVQDKVDEIHAKLDEGADFNDLIAEYGEDPGMQNEPTASRGYYVSADSTTWDKNFTAGAMSLANVGDVSETPVISTSGVHIIRYESDVTPGAVPLEEVHDKLYDEALESARTDHFNSELESWVADLKPEYHLESFTLQ